MKLCKNLFILYSFLISSIAFAAPADTYVIHSKIYSEGKLISAPQIISDLDQKAVINHYENKEHYFIFSLIASEVYKDVNNVRPLKMYFDIAYRNGQEKMQAKPTILAYPNQVADIKFNSKNGRQYELQVVAKKAT